MHAPIFYGSEDYTIRLAEIIDNNQGETFLDTSIISSHPLAAYDFYEKKYNGAKIVSLYNYLVQITNSSQHRKISKKIIKEFDKFYNGMIDLLNTGALFTPSVYLELQKMREHIGKVEQKQRGTPLISKPIHSTKKSHHIVEYISSSNIKEWYPIVNVTDSYNRKSIARTKDTIDEIIEMQKDYIKSALHSYELYGGGFNYLIETDEYAKILRCTTTAFNEYRKHSMKTHAHTFDHKILAEVITYSHFIGKKLNLITCDKDFDGIAHYINTKELQNIKCNISIFKRINSDGEKKPPVFSHVSNISYKNGEIIYKKAS